LGIGGANFASDDLMGTAQAELPWPGGGTVPVFTDAWKPVTFRRFDTSPDLRNPPFITVQSAGPDREYNTADDIWGYRLRQLGSRGNRNP
jgi:hypothetical protein